MRTQLWLLSILTVSGLGCDRLADPQARSVQCGDASFRSLPGEDCPCEPGLRSLTGDCAPEHDDTGEADDSGDCLADGSGCDGEDSGEQPPAACGYRTQTQGGWGTHCNGGDPGCYRDAHFHATFPEGLYIGCGVLTANLTNSLAIEQALPTGGKPRALEPAEAVGYDGIGDPKVKTVLFGQVVALSLSVGFDPLDDYDDGDQPLALGDLEIADPASACFGMLVSEVLTHANYALGGCPSQLSASTANDCLTAINESFDNGGDRCSALFAPPPAL